MKAMKHKQDGFSILEAIIIFVILGVIGSAVFFVINKNSDDNSNGFLSSILSKNEDSQPVSDCEGKNLSFTQSFFDDTSLAKIEKIEGQGLFAPPSHTYPVSHTYIFTNLKQGDKKLPIYAPAEGQLYLVGSGANPDGGINGAVGVSICNGISYHFGHVNEIAPEILAKTGCSASDCAWRPDQSQPIDIPAGTLLGYKGGEHMDVVVLDFGAVDTHSEPTPVPGGPEVWGEYVHAVCPYTYFSDNSMKDFFNAKLKLGNVRENLCGSLDIHVEGAMQGFWFDPKTPAKTASFIEEANHLVVGPINSTTDRDYIATGSFLPKGAVVEIGKNDGSQINTPIKDVHADGKKHCYYPLYSHHLTADKISGYLMFEMTSEKDLKVEYVDSGSCPNDVNNYNFTDSAYSFTRNI